MPPIGKGRGAAWASLYMYVLCPLPSNKDVHDCWNSKRRLLFILCRPRKTNFRFLLAENKRKLLFSVYIFIYICTSMYVSTVYQYVYICTVYAAVSNWKQKVQAIFLNLFTVCSLCKRKFVICRLSICSQRKQSYPFANRLNGLNGLNGIYRQIGLAHLCRPRTVIVSCLPCVNTTDHLLASTIPAVHLVTSY